MGTLTWLHLSDIHFRPQTEWKDATARAALLDHLKREIAAQAFRIDLVFCTGDIAYGELPGQPLANQYAMAGEFFDALLQVCGGDGQPLARERLFVVPGNHDIHRRSVDPAAQNTWIRWGDPAESREQRDSVANAFAAMEPPVSNAMQRLNDYGAFVADFLPHQQPALGHHHYAQHRDINGVAVGIAGFNSAWTCYGDKDDRKLWLADKPQFNAMREALEPAKLRIGLIHHPYDWFNEAERAIVRDRAEEDFDIWLHGHTHDLRVHAADDLVTVGAGSLTGDSAEELGYNIVRLDAQTGTGTAHLYHCDGNRSAWKARTIAKVAEHGVQTFQLPGTSGVPAAVTALGQDFIPPQLRRDPSLPPPAACLERSSELGRLAAWSEQTPPVPILICGYGGLGKTEIAVRYLHSAEARQHFGPRRYFVSVEGLENTPDTDLPGRFWSALALALFGRKTLPATADGLLDDLRGALAVQAQPALLVLDNFETVVLINTHFAVAALEQLAALAAQGLVLHVTLREPLPNLRAHCERLPLQPLQDRSAMRRMFCHWMHTDPDAILGPADAAALDHLLTLAEGWPIQLQMLGVAAEIEGLQSLAARCANATEMATLIAAQDQPDRHRHPHLSCRITYESPQLGDPARRLLRCLACFADGVPLDWLPDWPDAAALRELRTFKLLLEAQGRAGEARCKLPAPLRDFLRHAHPVFDEDRLALAQAWDAWWRRAAPEVFDTALPRREPAAYRDLHEQEFGSIMGLRLAEAYRHRQGNALFHALRNLNSWVGEISDWAIWLVELRRVSEQAAWLFGTAERARRFARLLAGSQSIETSVKRQIVDLIRQRALNSAQIDGLEKTFSRELDSWAWMWGSHELSERLASHLAEGRVCLEASAADFLKAIDELASMDERIALLDMGLNRHWTDDDRARLQRVQDTFLASPVSALGFRFRALIGSGQAALDDLRTAVQLQPNYGVAWYARARRLPASDVQAAWREVRRCAEDHLLETRRREWAVDQTKVGVLAYFQKACEALGDSQAVLSALDERARLLDAADRTGTRLELAADYLVAGQTEQAAEFVHRAVMTDMVGDEWRRSIRAFSQTLFPRAPQHALSIIGLLFTREEDADDLTLAATMLFAAGLPSLAYAFCRTAATAGIGASPANELAYTLLTRGDDAAETLALARKLAGQSFAQEAGIASAETLLCACLRGLEGADLASRASALSLLLAVDAASSEDDLPQLAGLMFDADRYAGEHRLAAWLVASPVSEREGTAGRALYAWTQGSAAPDAAAGALLTKLDDLRTGIAEQVAAQAAEAERLAEYRPEMAKVAQAWLDTIELMNPPAA